jgi:3',5'-nucleoside bisphosphate phosphatase
MIDLHTHSNCSDGSDSPEHLVELAAEAGLSAMALTDHDTVEGLSAAAARAGELNIELIPGIEFACHTPERNVHILAYYIDPDDSTLRNALAEQRSLRKQRNEHLLSVLNSLGYEITMDAVAKASGSGTTGRPHFAKALMDAGYVKSIEQAFTELLADGGPAYVERREFMADEAIELIHASGGLAVWAHPMRNKDVNDMNSTLEWLVAHELDGIETYYSLFTGDHHRYIKNAAKRHNLVATGGSDYHGSYKPDLSLGTGRGNLSIPDEIVNQLLERRAHFFGK